MITSILELPAGFRTPRGILLPPHDDFGIPHGADYEAHQKARTIRLSTRATFRGLKFHRRFEALSMNETRPLFSLAFNPYVVDIREQYPIYRVEDYNRSVVRGGRLQKTQVMSIDILATLVLPNHNGIHYHGISIKDACRELTDKDLRRQAREELTLDSRRWSWELLRGDKFSMRECANHWVLFRSVRDTNVFAYYDDAEKFAAALFKGTTRGTFDAIIRRVSRRLAIAPDLGHKLFAVGVSFGFIRIDHTRDLRVDAPLHLVEC